MALLPIFECDGCGACCQTFPIFVSEADARRESRIALESLQLSDDKQHPYCLFPLPFHQACCFLDMNQRCTIYTTRPNICREFQAGSSQCQEARNRNGMEPLKALINNDF
ncbi:MAG TPA: YkgJ family cysteine cluster protein [Gemmatales bacterium]|nr:YkgJ family cysteine cluster protein [Gemmatales bacterium]